MSRKPRRSREERISALRQQADALEREAQQAEAERINRAIDIYELKHLSELSWNEISEQMGVPYQQAQRDLEWALSDEAIATEIGAHFIDRALDSPPSHDPDRPDSTELLDQWRKAPAEARKRRAQAKRLRADLNRR